MAAKLTLPTYLFEGGLKGERPIREIAAICRTCQVQELSVNFTQQGEISFQSELRQLKTLKQDLDGMGVHINNITTLLTSGANEISSKCEEREHYRKIFEKMLDIGEALGIETLCAHICTSKVLSEYSYEEAIRLERERVQKLAIRCKERGLRFLLENVVDGLISTAEGYIEFLSGQPTEVGICYDIANSYFVCPPEHWLQTLRGKIEYLHLTDVRIKSLRGMLVEFVDLGQGLIHYPSVFRKIEEIGYEGPVLIESFEQRGQDDTKRVQEIIRLWQAQRGEERQ